MDSTTENSEAGRRVPIPTATAVSDQIPIPTTRAHTVEVHHDTRGLQGTDKRSVVRREHNVTNQIDVPQPLSREGGEKKWKDLSAVIKPTLSTPQTLEVCVCVSM